MTEKNSNTVVVSDPFARRLMARYLAQRKNDIESLRLALDDEDFERIWDKGHNLFGSGSAYGLDRISELGADLERSARAGDAKAVRQLIDALDSYVRNLRVA